MYATVKIETDNAAFEGPGGAFEIARIFRELAERLSRYNDEMTTPGVKVPVKDHNGNTVGHYAVHDYVDDDGLPGASSITWLEYDCSRCGYHEKAYFFKGGGVPDWEGCHNCLQVNYYHPDGSWRPEPPEGFEPVE